jgi:hypothetical protein
MLGMTRGVATLVGAAVAGVLLWLASQMGVDTAGEYWATYSLVAAAGLAMALSQVLGGWTKWGWPRLSAGVFLLGFLPVAIVGLWVLFAQQPGDRIFDTAGWSDDIGIAGLVSDLGELVAAVAFAIGLTLGFTVDTTGPKPRLEPAPGQPIERPYEVTRREEAPTVVEERSAADEPLTAERQTELEREREPVDTDRPPPVTRP